LVGSNLVVSGTNGSSNGLSTSRVASGITAATPLGGLQFTHYLQDVRGRNDGNTIFTAESTTSIWRTSK